MFKMLSKEIITEWDTSFRKDKNNLVARNAINNVGVYNVIYDTEKSSKVNHYFLHTLKPKGLKATNQGGSGRCWMFAGLNTFRHLLMRALHIKRFEFSAVYLFFWDKLERSNSFLQWFIDNSEHDNDSRYFAHIKKHYLTDGGYWSMFANLVDKYGLVPSNIMPETVSSQHSRMLKEHLNEILYTAMIHIKQGRDTDLQSFKKDTLRRIYSLLVKFLGNPPQSFDWYYENEEEGGSFCAADLDPIKFRDVGLAGLNILDFITLTCDVSQPFNTFIEIKYGNYMYDRSNVKFFNVNKNDLKRYARKSILAHFPVWFAGDINNGFNLYDSALDDELVDFNLLFEENPTLKYKDRVKYGLIQGRHAMVLCGLNMDQKDNVTEWQVENSWGYLDDEIPGLDGFLTMTDKWFDDYVIQIVVHKSLLSRSMEKIYNNAKTVVINPWEGSTPAFLVGGKNTEMQREYMNQLERKREKTMERSGKRARYV
jgi:bleomycin hydrolase